MKEIIEQIIAYEKKYGLFDIKYKKKYSIWPFYRMYFYFGFIEHLDKTRKRKGFSKNSFLKKILRFLNLTANSKLFSLFINQNKQFLIFSSQRYLNEEEIYTKDLKSVIKNNFLELSFSEQFVYKKGPIYLDHFKVLFKIISSIFYRFSDCHESIRNFVNELNIPKKFIVEFQRYRLEYIMWFNIFNLILKIQKPKKVFFVSGTYLTPLVAASLNNSIEIYEIQHGVINDLHLAYQFPNISREGFYSTGILLLSDYWKKKACYPKGTELITIGNNFYFSDERKIQNKKKVITFINQPIVTTYLTNFLKNNIQFFIKSGFKIYFKLHPSEFDTWETACQDLKQLHNSGLIKVITNSISINQLLLEAEYVFGVSSTAIYESLDRNCKVFIIEAPSSEYFDDLVATGTVKKIKYDTKLTTDHLKFVPKIKEKFFTSTNFEVLKKLTS